MDLVFLDANILFSASYRENSGLLRLWRLSNVELIMSHYALSEAQRNVISDAQLERLNRLPLIVATPVWIHDHLPEGVEIADKDLPILLDSINVRATHLFTGDISHFGALYGQIFGGVLIESPSAYLATRTQT